MQARWAENKFMRNTELCFVCTVGEYERADFVFIAKDIYNLYIPGFSAGSIFPKPPTAPLFSLFQAVPALLFFLFRLPILRESVPHQNTAS